MPFPLTLTLSLREREPQLRILPSFMWLTNCDRLTKFKWAADGSPSPLGRGPG